MFGQNETNLSKLFNGDILTRGLVNIRNFDEGYKRHAKLIAFFSSFFAFRYWIAPIGKSIGIKSTRSKRAAPNETLEAAYNANNRLRHKTVSVSVCLQSLMFICFFFFCVGVVDIVEGKPNNQLDFTSAIQGVSNVIHSLFYPSQI